MDDVQVPETTFALLSDEVRRVAVAYLLTKQSTVTFEDVVNAIVSSEVGNRMDDETIRRKRLRTVLHHHHLPKLNDAGIVDYDYTAKTVTPTNVEALPPSLD